MTTGIDPQGLRFTAADAGWLESAEELITTATAKATSEGRAPVLGLGNHDIMLNANLVTLAGRLTGQPGLPIAQLVPGPDGDNVSAYVDALTDPERGQPNLLVTSADERRDFIPVATQENMVKAAKESGFVRFGRLVQPNGEVLTLWWLDRGPSIPSAPSESTVPERTSAQQGESG